jgi:hypothetical protein
MSCESLLHILPVTKFVWLILSSTRLYSLQFTFVCPKQVWSLDCRHPEARTCCWYRKNLRQSLKRAYRTVRQSLERSYSTNKRYYDKKANDRTFEPGTILYLHNPMASSLPSRKFITIWMGPYCIKHRTGPLNYLKENQEGKEQVVHVNRLTIPVSGKQREIRKLVHHRRDGVQIPRVVRS